MKLSRNKGQSASTAENPQVKGFAFVSYFCIFSLPNVFVYLCLTLHHPCVLLCACVSVPRISDLKQQLSTIKAELDRYKKMAGLKTCGEVEWTGCVTFPAC